MTPGVPVIPESKTHQNAPGQDFDGLPMPAYPPHLQTIIEQGNGQMMLVVEHCDDEPDSDGWDVAERVDNVWKAKCIRCNQLGVVCCDSGTHFTSGNNPKPIHLEPICVGCCTGKRGLTHDPHPVWQVLGNMCPCSHNGSYDHQTYCVEGPGRLSEGYATCECKVKFNAKN